MLNKVYSYIDFYIPVTQINVGLPFGQSLSMSDNPEFQENEQHGLKFCVTYFITQYLLYFHFTTQCIMIGFLS